MEIATVAPVFVCLLLCGCASVTRGTTSDVEIQSQPEDAEIRTSFGHHCPASPCKVQVSRKTPFVAYAEKEGYRPGNVSIETKMSGAGAAGLAGNILIGGVIGVGIDAATGATLDHHPNPAVIVLEPLDSEQGPVPDQPAQNPVS